MKTRLTELLGIRHPIVLAGMTYVTNPELVAAVCNAGGLGLFACGHLKPEETRAAIKQIRTLTDKPFGINSALIFPLARGNVSVALEEKVPVINYSLGRPWFIDVVHGYGGKIIATVAALRHALRAEQLGADAVIVTGHEAAAHGGDVTSLVLIPQVASQVKVPVIGAGGFCDGRGLATALILGAEGVSMGTRLMLTRESQLHEDFKQLCLKATEQDTLYSTGFDSMPSRTLKTRTTEKLAKRGLSLPEIITGTIKMKNTLRLPWGEALRIASAMKKAGIPYINQGKLSAGFLRVMRAVYSGDKDGLLFCGQTCGMISDAPSCQEVIERIVAEAEAVLKAAAGRFSA
ncbi:NAD(P)H-dependent flavin oxidoreductase [Chloroflexota bacterium]